MAAFIKFPDLQGLRLKHSKTLIENDVIYIGLLGNFNSGGSF